MSQAATRSRPDRPADRSGEPPGAGLARWVPRLLWAALLGGSLLYLAAYALLAVLRVPYPFELEWMEGGSLEQVRRVLAGLPLYTTPSIHYAPYIYPPLYTYLAALAALPFGPSFVPLRLVALAASLGSALLIYGLVARETGQRRYGLVALGLFFACFRLTGAWFDIARVDTLALFLLLGATYAVRREPTTRGAVLAAILVALATWAKQTALLYALPLFLAYVFVARRRALVFGLTLATVLGVLVLTGLALYGEWLPYYLVQLPRQHGLTMSRITGFWSEDVLRSLAIATILGASFLVSLWLDDRRDEAIVYTLTAGGLVGLAWAGRVNPGGYTNVLLPLSAALAILLPLALHRGIASARALPPAKRPILEGFVLLLAVVQLGLLFYDPKAQFPRPRDAEAGSRLVQALQALPGEVFIPDHGYLATLAGKPGSLHTMTFDEIAGSFGGRPTDDGERVIAELRTAVREQRFAAVILNEDSWPEWFVNELNRSYRPRENVFADEWVFWPVTGGRRRPSLVYLAPWVTVDPFPLVVSR